MQLKNRYCFRRWRIRGFLLTVVALSCIAFSALPGWSEELGHDYNYGLGKINLRSQSPAQSLRFTLPLLIPGDIKPGWETRIANTWSNVWANESEYLLDYEMSETIVTVTYGFNERFGLSLEFENRNYFGGEMDGFIQGFHDLFGISQDGRDDVSKNRKVIQRFDPKTGQMLSETSAEDLENNGIVLLMSYTLTHGTKIWPSANVFGGVRYGLKCADLCRDNHPVDVGLGFGLAKRWSKRWYTYASLGYTLYESRDVLEPAPGVVPIDFEDRAVTGLFVLSWHYTPTFSILVQYLYSGPNIKNIDVLDQASHEIHFGFKWKTRYGLIELALIENVITMSNSPDFGLHGGWGLHF
ncbi:MAG: DUF3187 family protein [Desulfobacterales bacterium]|jgi:hypothetical protein